MVAAPRRIPSLLVLLLAVAASVAQAAPRDAPGPEARVVTQLELEQSRQSNLYDFVRAHRPQWLRTRGAIGLTAVEVAVIVDGQRVGGPDQLRGISSEITRSLRYLDGREATTRWGSGHGSGAILVATGPLRAQADAIIPTPTALAR